MSGGGGIAILAAELTDHRSPRLTALNLAARVLKKFGRWRFGASTATARRASTALLREALVDRRQFCRLGFLLNWLGFFLLLFLLLFAGVLKKHLSDFRTAHSCAPNKPRQ